MSTFSVDSDSTLGTLYSGNRTIDDIIPGQWAVIEFISNEFITKSGFDAVFLDGPKLL